MIRDFFLLLVAVTAVELGLRYAVVVYEFQSHDRAKVDLAAKQLASDVKSIMMNAGGPLAARTVYPILKRNFEDMGLSLAIVPSEATVSSMKARFDMEPQGVHPQWAAGKHNESTIALTADQFCLGCQVSGQMNAQFEGIQHSVQLAIRHSLGEQAGNTAPIGGPDAMEAMVSTLDILGGDARIPEETRKKLREISGRLRARKGQAGDFPRWSARSGDALMNLSRDVHGFTHFLGEMDVLEEKMRVVAESGQTLLDRLTHTRQSAAVYVST